MGNKHGAKRKTAYEMIYVRGTGRYNKLDHKKWSYEIA
jgi:hypothetical protein